MSVSALAEVAMLNDMRQLDLISNNLANANTAGFKGDLIVQGFAGQLDQANSELVSNAGAMNHLQAEVLTDFAQGALKKTGNPLDVAVEGAGFFQLMTPEGLNYTRGGSFSVDSQGRLVGGDGDPVLGVDGEILIGNGDVAIGRDGNITEDGEHVGQLSIVEFSDSASLIKAGSGGYMAPDGLMAQPADSSSVRQGFVEASNVNVMGEMVSMMSMMRHFEMTANVLKGYDEIMNSAISSIAEF